MELGPGSLNRLVNLSKSFCESAPCFDFVTWSEIIWVSCGFVEHILECSQGVNPGKHREGWIQGSTELLYFAWCVKVSCISLLLTLLDTKWKNGVDAVSTILKEETITICQHSCVYGSLWFRAKRQFSNCILNDGSIHFGLLFSPVFGKWQNFYCIGRYWSCEEDVKFFDVYWFKHIM